MKVLVTGGAGFIGSALCRHLVARPGVEVVVVDKLTYAASIEALAAPLAGGRLALERLDVTDRPGLTAAFARHRPDAVVHLAAETHVDRSIDGSSAFVATNVVGTHGVLEAARTFWTALAGPARARFRLLHVSTDEVYGSLGATGAFTETSRYAPSSPYAATKAAADHLVGAWGRTYGLPVLIASCSNNYGPYQFPEKLIPLMVIKALAGEALPLYGTGANVRDWLHVDDHARALHLILTRGRPGERYNVGGGNERSNLQVVEALCAVLDARAPRADGRPHRTAITFVADRPGHDHRYAIDGSKIRDELGWRPTTDFAAGLADTVGWLLANRPWWERIRRSRYGGERLGLAAGGEASGERSG